ncbi:phage tail protein [Rahnella aceris]|uniref:phage tail protein n=1 Tax=Rahnella sp. (strain Y9602) TaxID=2703885 RepID=UPI001F382D3E|nr:phage tail protein [Rahnella aceris]
MTTKYFALLTNQGAAKLANAAALGTKVQITQMGVGDGGGALPTPTGTQTALIGEKRRASLNALSVDAANSSQIIAEQIIPENEGGFWIREIGLYDSENTLIAVANCPETYKPLLAEGSGRTQTVRMILIINSTDAVTLKIDPSVVLATRQYVDSTMIEVKAYADDLMAKHLVATEPHPQYALSDSLTGVVGTSRNAKMNIAAASASATFTADELIVQTALGGRQYKIAKLNKTLNLAIVGAGGMDIGAVSASGFVAIYAIFNPLTRDSALLAVNLAAAAVAPEVYAGANMPGGFTASALVSVWLVAGSKLTMGIQTGRHIVTASNQVFSATSVIPATPTGLSLSAYIPANAKEVDIFQRFVSTSADFQQMAITSTINSIGLFGVLSNASAVNQQFGSTGSIKIVDPQTLYYYQTGAVSTTRQLYVLGYIF